MPPLSADKDWFKLSIEGDTSFGVYSIKGREKISTPYEFELELVSRNPAADLNGLLGKSALLTMADHSGELRDVHGLIREAEQLHTANLFTHYRIWIVPRFWFLSQNLEHRIFQKQTAVEIISDILKKQGFPSETVVWQLKEKYDKREYCVQYGESDLHFISRLCEEEGIYFYFDHKKDMHKVCFSDAAGGFPIPGASRGLTRFFPGSGQAAEDAVVHRLNMRRRINSDAVNYTDWNYKKPKLDLAVALKESDPKKAPAPAGMNLEVYQYLPLYNSKDGGQRQAKMQLLRQLSFAQWIEGESNLSRLTPGFGFTLFGHPRPDVNAQWWLTEVSHFGEQPQVLGHEAPDRGLVYQSRFTAIPFLTRFVPKKKHSKNPIKGQQTAIVTGPPGEEIFPDQYGRVKVEFHWDRRRLGNEKSSRWVRVAHGWAGGKHGSLSIPRIGSEVLVSFIEGDPDHPIITGAVYHEINQVHYDMPGNKTRTTFKSFSSPGGGGFNELRIEDRKGQEELFIHAQKDTNMVVLNDFNRNIGHDQTNSTGNNSSTTTGGETRRTLVKDRMSELQANDHMTIGANRQTKIAGADELNAGSVRIKAGSIILEADSEILLMVGGSFISIDPSLIVQVAGDINLNCGETAPELSDMVDPTLPGDEAK